LGIPIAEVNTLLVLASIANIDSSGAQHIEYQVVDSGIDPEVQLIPSGE
jgi:hypothetical protein